MNVKLLRKVKNHILAEPKRFYMPWFIVRKHEGGEYGKTTNFPKCGTIGCIAGWACLLHHGMKFKGDEYHEAQRLLKLNGKQAERLFTMGGAPEQFNAIYEGDGKPATATACADRIEHFIKTKGRE